MSEFGDGFTIATQLRELADRIDAHMTDHLEHEADEGAHAAAFDAHAQSPGVVERAEELAEQILTTAEETAEAAIEGVEAAGNVAVEAVENAAEGAEDVVTDTTDTIEEIVEPEGKSEDSEPKSEGERAPARVHPLHRRIG